MLLVNVLENATKVVFLAQIQMESLMSKSRKTFNRELETAAFLLNLKEALPKLDALLVENLNEWIYEDLIYRLYHQSFKVFRLQEQTEKIVDLLTRIKPSASSLLNKSFLTIIASGTGKTFSLSDNKNWLEITRPIVEAYLHAKFFLEMACKYGHELSEQPQILPSGWAALLYLYNLR